MNYSDQSMIVLKFPDYTSGSFKANLSANTSPVVPLIVMKSPSLNTLSFIFNIFFSSSISYISEQPQTHVFPIPLATTAACDVIPPLAVKIPLAASIPSISSGLVSNLANITAFPYLCQATAVAASNTNYPTAAPGLAPSPLPNKVADLRPAGSI